jgi:hypothetical protein
VPITVPAGQLAAQVPPALDAVLAAQAAHAAPSAELSPAGQSVHAPPAVDVLPAGHFVHAPPAIDVSFAAQFAHAAPATDVLPAGHLVHIDCFTTACSVPIGHLVHSVASVVVENVFTAQSVQVLLLAASANCPTTHAFKFLLINIINKYARFVFIFYKMNFIYLLTY